MNDHRLQTREQELRDAVNQLSELHARLVAIIDAPPPTRQPPWWRRKFAAGVTTLALLSALIGVVIVVIPDREEPLPPNAVNPTPSATSPMTSGRDREDPPPPSSASQCRPTTPTNASMTISRGVAHTLWEQAEDA